MVDQTAQALLSLADENVSEVHGEHNASTVVVPETNPWPAVHEVMQTSAVQAVS